MRLLWSDDALAFGAVFTFEAALFIAAALMAAFVIERPVRGHASNLVPGE
jgi:BCD family chlorophyll transporter-like MFS transporter